jgi:hypothetical protein
VGRGAYLGHICKVPGVGDAGGNSLCGLTAQGDGAHKLKDSRNYTCLPESERLGAHTCGGKGRGSHNTRLCSSEP